MDDGGGLENRYAGDCIVGSNPTPSATFLSPTIALSLINFCRVSRLLIHLAQAFNANPIKCHHVPFIVGKTCGIQVGYG